MSLPINFDAAAKAVPNVTSAPAFEKRLVVLDWDKTLLLANGQPNKYLFLLATTAAQNGHDVVIATRATQHDVLKEMLTDLIPYHIGFELPEFRIFHKHDVRQKMKDEGYDQAFYVFDDEPENVPEYMDTKYVAKVEPNGRIPDLGVAAILLKVDSQFNKVLKKSMDGKLITLQKDFEMKCP